jgi:hypothetical protein
MKDKIEELVHTKNHIEKKTQVQHIRTLENNQKTKSRIHRVKEWVGIQTKVTGNLLNEIIAENFPNLCNNTHSCTRRISISK